MSPKNSLVLYFNQIDKRDTSLVGGKGANLGEMTKAGFPVPFGFAITVEAYDMFLDSEGIRDEIMEKLAHVDKESSEELSRVSSYITKKILSKKVPDEVAGEVIKAYRKISGRFKKCLVA